jgi:ankyrin repeat protein
MSKIKSVKSLSTILMLKQPLDHPTNRSSSRLVSVVSAQDLEGSTALHLAADQGHREIINLLIDHGAEVGLVDKLGRTPLHRSARLGYGNQTLG